MSTSTREASSPQLGITALFSRGELPEQITVTGRYSPLSPVCVGERYRWRESSQGVGCYEPQDGGTIHLMAHEVRRNFGRFYQATDARMAVA